ncbi:MULTISPECIES: FmdB family zinc ribbon protein [Streptosporangium]|uniref:FmdB family regulatory protein n=1 Tax=Streptosporangium brasiliense TaxID=47480 RepID=A0ABT9R3B8_9ACTN|nr:putative FmdB family regulatory protein [Streptosporangium brasiliense]
MATYEYLCRECGRFDVQLPIGTAPASRDCSACGRGARRVFSPPGLSRVHPALSAALDLDERSREAPEVVSNIPREHPPRPPHPALARLPRP